MSRSLINVSLARHFALAAAWTLVAVPVAFGATLSGCDFDGDGVDDHATIERNRIVYSDALPGGKLALGGLTKHVQCVDTDGDGSDEVVGVSMARTVSVAPIRNRALKNVCKTSRSLFRGEIWKSIASHHISDQRKNSTSFITLRSTTPPRSSCLNGYDKKGNLVHKLGQYFPTGAAYSSRFYGGFGCGDRRSAASVANTARAKTGSPEIYITSGTGNCARIPNANACYNSSGC